jgi:sugar-specific transcriptional regulator TrmB
VLEISRELGLPRTSVYDGVAKLQDKGLVEKIVQHKNQRIKAYPVDILQTYIDHEKARAELLQEKLVLLEQNIAHADPSALATEVRYYHGTRGMQQMIWNTLRAEDELLSYSQFGMANILGMSFTGKYVIERKRRGIKGRVVTNPQYVDKWRTKFIPGAEYRKAMQQCRVIPTELLHVTGDITIYNNVFAAAYWDKGEGVGVEIENQEIVKTQKTLFNIAWQQGEPVAWDENSA